MTQQPRGTTSIFSKRGLKQLLSNTLLNKDYIGSSKLRRSIVEAIPGFAKGVVLDVGCGVQPYADLLKSQSQVSRYLSLEYPGATDYFGEPFRGVDVFGDAQRLPFRSERVDTVLCSEVIEHVPEPGLLLEEIHRVLRTGGTVILTAPSTFQLHLEPHDYFRFTKHGLAHLFAKAKLRVLQVKTRGFAPAAIGQSISSYLNDALVADPRTKQPRLWRAALVLPVCAVIQGVSLLLDRFSTSDTLTVGYTVIARKE